MKNDKLLAATETTTWQKLVKIAHRQHQTYQTYSFLAALLSPTDTQLRSVE